jgi:alkylated DNA repair dioxygenase AlkB
MASEKVEDKTETSIEPKTNGRKYRTGTKKSKVEDTKTDEKPKTEDVKETENPKTEEKPKKEKKENPKKGEKAEDNKKTEEKPKKEKAKKEKPKKEKAKTEEKKEKPKKEKAKTEEKKEKPKKEKPKKEKKEKAKKETKDEKDVPDLLPSVLFESDFFPSDIWEAARKYLISKIEEKGFYEQPTIPTAGGPTKIPRLERLMAEEDQEYTYSHHTLIAVPWVPEIKALKDFLEAKLNVKVKSNGVLINVYPDGSFHVSWHPDSDKDLVPGEPIYSVSMGDTRKFSLRQIKKPKRVFDYDLCDNSVFVMKHPTNTNFEHCIRKTAKPVGLRINLTFRCFTEESMKKKA